MSDSQHNSQQDEKKDDKQDDKQNGNEGAKNQHLFLSLVTSMQMGAMYQLGKIASPISGKIERDLRQAQNTIDLLAMLQARTEGNLAADESEHLRRIISELRLNYIDESAKPDAPEESEGSTEESKGAGASNETFADSADKTTTSE